MKCYKCKKKTLIEYKCKCDNIFCLNCISSFIHHCSFDYRNEKRKLLEEQNIKVLPDKVLHI